MSVDSFKLVVCDFKLLLLFVNFVFISVLT